MPNGESSLIQLLNESLPVALLSVLGGLFDYLFAIQTGKRIWSIGSFVLHLGFCLFVGYIAATVAMELGYSAKMAGAIAGAAGFLNIRIIDLIVLHYKNHRHSHEAVKRSHHEHK